MKRKIISIDDEKCNGCGVCIPDCPEGALQLIDGKARLISDLFCDGLGACIGSCPEDAISVEEREAEPYDESKVMHAGGCPGSRLMNFDMDAPSCEEEEAAASESMSSRLKQWPVQIMLIPPHALFLNGADLLFVADCVPFSPTPSFTRSS